MKKIISLILALAMVMCLAACGGGGENSAEPTVDVMAGVDENIVADAEQTGYIRDHITVAVDAIATLAPWGTQVNQPAIYSSYEMLYGISHSGEVYPWLADATYEGNFRPGCDHEPGTGIYTVHIYNDIYDHAGNHITAEDVAWSFMYQYKNAATSGWGDLQNVEAVDETTVKFIFAEEQNGLGELDNIFSRQFIASKNAWLSSATNLVGEIIGTGPYKMTDYVSGVSVTLERYEDYWMLKNHPEQMRDEMHANVQVIDFQIVTETTQKVLGVQTGSLELLYNMAMTDVTDFMDGGAYADAVNVYAMQHNMVNYLWANCHEESICSDINMRLAIYYALDLDALVALRNSYDTPAIGYVSAYYNDYQTEWESWTNYNTYRGGAVEGIGQSREEIVKYYQQQAGYNGEPLVLLTGTPHQATADIVTNILTNAGFTVDLQVRDRSTQQAMQADPTQWDMEIDQMAGDPYNVLVWQHGYSFSCTSDGDHSMNFIYDKAFNDQIDLVCTGEGHTPEEMNKWMQMFYDNAYGMGLFTENKYFVYPNDMVHLTFGDKNTVLPGACIYADPNA